MTQINIQIEDLPVQNADYKAKIVKFSGELDESNVDEKSTVIYNLINENPGKLYLLMDFEELNYMNSKSIGYLTDWYSKIVENNGKIVIAKAKSNVQDVLEVVGLGQLINLYPSLEEAKLALLSG